MKTTTLHTLGESTIDFDPTVPCLIHNHRGFMMSDEFRKQLNAGLELLINMKKELGKSAWLANTKEADVITEEDQQWIASEWSKKMQEGGIKHIALIVPDDELARYTVNLSLDHSKDVVKDRIVRKMFTEVEAAKAWLREVLNN